MPSETPSGGETQGAVGTLESPSRRGRHAGEDQTEARVLGEARSAKAIGGAKRNNNNDNNHNDNNNNNGSCMDLGVCDIHYHLRNREYHGI